MASTWFPVFGKDIQAVHDIFKNKKNEKKKYPIQYGRRAIHDNDDIV